MNSIYYIDRENFYDWEDNKELERASLEYFISINESLDLIKLDPNAKVRESKKIDFFGAYKLFDINSCSVIRSVPIRVLYNKTNMDFFYLDGSEQTIYEALKLNRRLSPIDQNNVLNYIKFFLNHVGDKTGRYELVKDPEDIRNRINLFYLYENSKIHQELCPVKFTNYEEAFNEMFESFPIELEEDDSQNIIINNIFIIFRKSLYRVGIQVSISKDETKFGKVRFLNEEVCETTIIEGKNIISFLPLADSELNYEQPFFEDI